MASEKEISPSIQSDHHPSSKETTQTQHHEESNTSLDLIKSFEEERIEHVPEGTASCGKALFMLLKAFVGTGVVFLPGGFVSGGLVFSICLMIFIAIVCLFAFQMLIQAQRTVGGDYGQVAQELYGRWLRYLVLFFLCLSQMGFVASYLIFVSENLGLVVDQLSHCHRAFEAPLFIWLVLLIIIPITWVRKIARLSWNAIIADVFILFGLISVIYFTSDQITHNGPGPNIRMINTSDFALMIGTAVFSFEGIGMVVPIIQGMKEPEKFPRVLTLGMIICTCLFVLIGTLGYVAFGENTHASVVSNLPPQNGLSVTVQLFYAIAMILTSPFMLYPPLIIIERGLFGAHRSGRSNWKYKWGKNLVRSIIPIICAAISFGVGPDGLNKFVALVGSIACMPLSFIIPGLFHFKVSKGRWMKVADVVMTLWGIGIMIYTLYVNIHSWIAPAASSFKPSSNICSS
ncbi:transmembrane amino acid transporter protein-domain-containing protein [Halteromyces radiatus]|uniref:transmembrane amino acid transporter protein-domain-containing protein n=1 Tax=Halteromyces radiatus TaxID=101107 RepID=UPI002220A99E|nr:transmembrane amino acid transporter protein-domain-containing protein [Halteromyces radiatus]KAI8092619.1 transmembrane amino acid transporter protein-domain-containing protein [Halteromyces radiatus]